VNSVAQLKLLTAAILYRGFSNLDVSRPTFDKEMAETLEKNLVDCWRQFKKRGLTD
jgi:hypothetical protein